MAKMYTCDEVAERYKVKVITVSAICDSIYGELQKSGKHMVMARRKREQKP